MTPGNLYGGLVRGGGVCGAYSRAYQYLMQRLGVPCAFLSGTSVRGIPHAWNAVKLEDGWYYVDATWDDLPDETGYLYHDYLLVTLEEISLEHFPEPGQYRELPPGDSDRYSYYRQFGYCADLGDPDPVAAMAAGFARRLADQPLPAARQPSFSKSSSLGSTRCSPAGGISTTGTSSRCCVRFPPGWRRKTSRWKSTRPATSNITITTIPRC